MGWGLPVDKDFELTKTDPLKIPPKVAQPGVGYGGCPLIKTGEPEYVILREPNLTHWQTKINKMYYFL